ncbi:MAG TPA: hypothetical protein PK776_15300, partial [Flavobacterium sp.]|nr:hypothetical protein [Flavobacterium sp.]
MTKMTNRALLQGRISALLLPCLFPMVSQAQDILWENSYGGKHAEFLADALPTPDYGFLLAGSSLSDKNGNKEMVSSGNFDYWLWKMDEH